MILTLELNDLEFARWRAVLLEGGFSTDAAWLAKDHINYLHITSNTVRITFKDSNELAKLIKSFPSFQKNKVLSKLLHDTGRTMPLVTNPKSTVKLKPESNPKSKPYVQRLDCPPQPTPSHTPYNAWQQPPPASPYRQHFNNGYYRSPNNY